MVDEGDNPAVVEHSPEIRGDKAIAINAVIHKYEGAVRKMATRSLGGYRRLCVRSMRKTPPSTSMSAGLLVIKRHRTFGAQQIFMRWNSSNTCSGSKCSRTCEQ